MYYKPSTVTEHHCILLVSPVNGIYLIVNENGIYVPYVYDEKERRMNSLSYTYTPVDLCSFLNRLHTSTTYRTYTYDYEHFIAHFGLYFMGF